MLFQVYLHLLTQDANCIVPLLYGELYIIYLYFREKIIVYFIPFFTNVNQYPSHVCSYHTYVPIFISCIV